MDNRFKAIAGLVGLLTAIIVLIGTLTDQGWLPSPVKDSVQTALPGQQPGESSSGGGAGGGGTHGGVTERETAPTPSPPAPPSPTPGTYGPDTCIQGYVWREAIANDHVCVTPEVRDQTSEDNRLADSRRSPTGGAFGPNTCLPGYVWRVVVPTDLVCVTPETRDQVAQDNQLADSRRAR
jgi:hypothetical protein